MMISDYSWGECQHNHHQAKDCPLVSNAVLGVNQAPAVLTGQFLIEESTEPVSGNTEPGSE